MQQPHSDVLVIVGRSSSISHNMTHCSHRELPQPSQILGPGTGGWCGALNGRTHERQLTIDDGDAARHLTPQCGRRYKVSDSAGVLSRTYAGNAPNAPCARRNGRRGQQGPRSLRGCFRGRPCRALRPLPQVPQPPCPDSPLGPATFSPTPSSPAPMAPPSPLRPPTARPRPPMRN